MWRRGQTVEGRCEQYGHPLRGPEAGAYADSIVREDSVLVCPYFERTLTLVNIDRSQNQCMVVHLRRLGV